MQNLIAQLASDVSRFPKGDILVVFDNQQIVGREYRVELGGTLPISIVTTLIVLHESNDQNVQQIALPSIVNVNLLQLYKSHVTHGQVVHSRYRKAWVTQRLDIVQQEQVRGSFEKSEHLLKEATYEKGIEYDRVPNITSSCGILDMQNLMMNPNSYANVAKVLSSILEMSLASDPSRKRISVYCDGQPYNIASKLLDNFTICSTCKTSGMNLACRTKSGHATKKSFDKNGFLPRYILRQTFTKNSKV